MLKVVSGWCLCWIGPICSAITPPPAPPYAPQPASVYFYPTVPSSNQPVTITIYDLYDAGEFLFLEPRANVKQISWSVEGNTINVTAELVPNFVPGSPPVVTIPPLPEGEYTIAYDGTKNVTHPEAHVATRKLVVSDNSTVTVVEFYNPQLDHYFITADPDEIALLDRGVIRGWVRTGEVFRTYSREMAVNASYGVAAMCRMYGLPAAGLDSHFFASNAECANVLARWPSSWVLETRDAFGIDGWAGSYGPDPSSTTCGDDEQPLYRLYNGRPDANHRYTTSRTIRDKMVAAGWTLEGPTYDFRPIVPGDVKQIVGCVFR